MNKPTIDTAQKCKLCGGEFTVRGILSRIRYFWPEVDVVVSDGPCCHHTEELRVDHHKVERGYVYAAGDAHFCGVEQYDVPDLSLIEKKDNLVFILGREKYTVKRED